MGPTLERNPDPVTPQETLGFHPNDALKLNTKLYVNQDLRAKNSCNLKKKNI